MLSRVAGVSLYHAHLIRLQFQTLKCSINLLEVVAVNHVPLLAT